MKRKLNNIGVKSLSVLLSVLMILAIFPLSVFAEVELRTESAKYYQLADGTQAVAQYSSPVHRLDNNISPVPDSTEYHFAYDVFGNSTAVNIGTTRRLAAYTYNAGNGKLNTLTYGNGDQVKYVYDALDRVSEVWYNTGENGALEKAYSYAYDGAGNLFSTEDHQNGRVTVYEYDIIGRPLRSYTYDSETMTNLYAAQMQYTEESKIDYIYHSFDYACGTAARDGVFKYNYTYHQQLGHVQSILLDDLDGPFNGSINLTYDGLNRVSVKSFQATDGANSASFSYGYTYTTGNGGNAGGLVSRLTFTVGSYQKIYDVTYDANGNITKIELDQPVLDYVYRYAYDDLGQLLREDNPEFGRTFVYTYDDAGNILTKTTYMYSETDTLGELQSTDTYTYGDTSWGDLLTAWNGNAITYDTVGNPTRIATSATSGYDLVWQGRQLLSYTGYGNNTEVISYTYNADGIRTSKTVNGVKHEYDLNGSQIIAERWGDHFLIYLYDESGAPLGLGYRTSSYVQNSFNYYYFEKNLQGDIVALYSESGYQVGTYYYDAFGNYDAVLTNSGNSVDMAVFNTYNPFRYRGYYYDAETGLYYLQSRYYDPQWGRFINADSQLIGGDLLGMNMFAYCGNNPVNRLDPTGEAWWHWVLGGAIVAGCAIAVVATAGGAVAGIAAVASVANGVAAATTASTIAAGAFIGSATVYGMAAMSAAFTSSSVQEFNDQGNWGTVAATAGGAIIGGTGAYLGARDATTTSTTTNPQTTSTIKNDIIDLPRTGSALKTDAYHAFPNIVDNYAGYATKSPISNGMLYQLQGSLNGTAGRFEWIVQNQQVTHRMFVPGGGINGIPIMP